MLSKAQKYIKKNQKKKKNVAKKENILKKKVKKDTTNDITNQKKKT